MAEVYASPAKRRKVLGAGALCDAADEAGSYSKSRFHTPSKLKQQSADTAEPETPGGQIKKQLSQTSTEDAGLSPQPLAPDLMLLNQLLGALYVTLPMVRGRGKATTYHNMRVPVQNFCGRDFQIKHVQQIKALFPEALGWEHVLALNPSTKRQEQQLVINMPRDASNPKQAVDTAQLQQTFFQRLQQHQACAGTKASELTLPLAELPPAAVPSTRDCTPSRQRIGSLVPGTPQTAPPAAGNTAQQLMMSPPPKRLATVARAAPPASTSLMMSPPPARTRGGNRKLLMGGADGESSFTFSPAPRQPDLLLSPRGGGGAFSTRGRASTPARPDAQDAPAAGHQTPQQALRPNRLFDTPLASATPQQSSAARPNTHTTPEAAPEGGRSAAAAAGVKVRKLTFEAAAPSASKAAAAPKAEALKARGGIKFELGESAMALLRQVSSAEVKQEAAVKHQELEQQRALDMLPGSFEVVRSIYGERGPCVKPKAEVLTLLRQKSTCKSGMSASDAAGQLDLMLRLVPEFLRTVTTSGASLAGITQSVRINRQVSWTAARQKLLAGAAEARCSGSVAAAQAVAAEQQREADEAAALAAAAAAAAVAAEVEDESSGSGSESEEEVFEARGPVDELGLDVLAELNGNPSSSSNKAGSSSKGKAGSACGLADEALALLGGGGGGGKRGGAEASGALLGALSCKAPAKKGTAKR